MFQFLTSTPSIKEIIAVNPKEYYVAYDDGTNEQKHKGVPKNINLLRNVYLNRTHSYNYLRKEEKYIKSEQIFYNKIVQKKKQVFKEVQRKVGIAQLHDKAYIFHDGCCSLPHGHASLRHIVEMNKSVDLQYLQSDEYLDRLKTIEHNVLIQHPRLKYYHLFITENEHLFPSST